MQKRRDHRSRKLALDLPGEGSAYALRSSSQTKRASKRIFMTAFRAYTRKDEIKECREFIEYESNQICVKLKRMKCNSESYFWDNVIGYVLL